MTMRTNWKKFFNESSSEHIAKMLNIQIENQGNLKNVTSNNGGVYFEYDRTGLMYSKDAHLVPEAIIEQVIGVKPPQPYSNAVKAEIARLDRNNNKLVKRIEALERYKASSGRTSYFGAL